MRSFFRRYVLNDLDLKILALLISVALWWMVGRDPVVERPFTAPVQFRHTPGDLVMSSDTPFEVQVSISGPERAIRALKPTEIDAVLDLAGVRAGERTFDLGPRQVQVPRGLTVIRVVPSQLHIAFSPNATRQVDVRPRVIGTFVAGYGITSVTADPAVITIGPQNRVNAIDVAITDPVDATGVVGRATFTTHAYVPDPLVRIQHPAPIHVTVSTGKPSRGASQP